MTLLVALVSTVSFHDLPNLNFSVFCEVLLKFSKFCQPYGNFGGKRQLFCLAGPLIFRQQAGNPGSQ